MITPDTGFHINLALLVHLLNSLESMLARGAHTSNGMPYQATNNVQAHPIPGTLGSRAEMRINRLDEGQN